MFKIQTLNNISLRGLERLPRDRYEVASDIAHPDAILVRSADMHALAIPASVQAVGRAGAGTNNIPVTSSASAASRCSMRRAPMPMRSRNWCWPGCCWRRATSARHGSSSARLEATTTRWKTRWSRARSSSSGHELPGRTLGVIGLGAIGVEVANAALDLGMKVLGYDPHITVQRAWQLSSGVEQALQPGRPVRALRLRSRCTCRSTITRAA